MKYFMSVSNVSFIYQIMEKIKLVFGTSAYSAINFFISLYLFHTWGNIALVDVAILMAISALVSTFFNNAFYIPFSIESPNFILLFLPLIAITIFCFLFYFNISNMLNIYALGAVMGGGASLRFLECRVFFKKNLMLFPVLSGGLVVTIIAFVLILSKKSISVQNLYFISSLLFIIFSSGSIFLLATSIIQLVPVIKIKDASKLSFSFYKILFSVTSSLRVNAPVLFPFIVGDTLALKALSFSQFIYRPISFIFPTFAPMIYKDLDDFPELFQNGVKRFIKWVFLYSILVLPYFLYFEVQNFQRVEFLLVATTLILQNIFGYTRNVMEYISIRDKVYFKLLKSSVLAVCVLMIVYFILYKVNCLEYSIVGLAISELIYVILIK